MTCRNWSSLLRSHGFCRCILTFLRWTSISFKIFINLFQNLFNNLICWVTRITSMLRNLIADESERVAIIHISTNCSIFSSHSIFILKELCHHVYSLKCIRFFKFEFIVVINTFELLHALKWNFLRGYVSRILRIQATKTIFFCNLWLLYLRLKTLIQDLLLHLTFLGTLNLTSYKLIAKVYLMNACPLLCLICLSRSTYCVSIIITCTRLAFLYQVF